MPDPSAEPKNDHTDKSTVAPGGNRSILGLHRSDQVFVAVMLAALVILSVVYWTKLSGWGQKPVEIKRLPVREYDFRLDVNSATWVQWAQLEGIGEVLARRIVADRNQQGPFATVDDIRRVNGIGAKKLDAIREWLYVTPAADDE
ncbi:ComE operon protein 1 [Symmachiella dynata]|uniref:ComEA family DNA-binding protein n=1 Tax=Symmachiella dynata TaxID=2527995 RepID=UPI0011890742|nr:helix-hairpin-helix domain-containing protein [Symmachiella dynata]QDT47051.1 ComE operon protein 1 [Symmachiella dynata]